MFNQRLTRRHATGPKTYFYLNAIPHWPVFRSASEIADRAVAEHHAREMERLEPEPES